MNKQPHTLLSWRQSSSAKRMWAHLQPVGTSAHPWGHGGIIISSQAFNPASQMMQGQHLRLVHATACMSCCCPEQVLLQHYYVVIWQVESG